MALLDVYRIDVRHRLDNQDIVNTFTYVMTRDVGVWDEIQKINYLLGAFDGRFGPELGSCWTNRGSDYTIKVTLYKPRPIDRISISGVFHPAGRQDLPNAPTGTALVIARRTNQTSRSANGRLFVGGIPIASITGGVMNLASATWGNATSLAANMLLPFREGPHRDQDWEFYPVIASIRGTPPVMENWPWVRLVYATPRQTLGTRRSRLPGHGRRG